jgi:hypothetical protein
MLLRNFVSRLYENLKVQTDYPDLVREIDNGKQRGEDRCLPTGSTLSSEMFTLPCEKALCVDGSLSNNGEC